MVRRNFITGEFEDVEVESGTFYFDREQGKIVKGSPPREKSTCSAVCNKRPKEYASGAIHVDQVAEFNKVCARGVHYNPANGNLVSTSDAATKREAKRRSLATSSM